LKSLLSAAVVAAAVGFLAWYGWRHAADLPELSWRAPGLWVNLVAAIALYDVAAVVSAWNWRGLLSAFGGRSRRFVAESVYLMTQIGKYLPGNVGHFVGRVAVGRMRGISAASCAASMVCEQLLTVSSAVLFVASGYLLSPADFEPLEHYLPAAPWIAAILLAAAITPMVLGSVANRVGRWMPGRLRPALLELRNLGLPHIVGFVAVCCMVFVIFGVIVARVAEAVAGAPVLPIAAAAVGFAAAWVLGLITPGAPGGMGVRETILVVCFAPLVGDGEAFTIALAMRLVSVLGDGTAFLIGFAGDRLLHRRTALNEQ
jgi:hypothetical protein